MGRVNKYPNKLEYAKRLAWLRYLLRNAISASGAALIRNTIAETKEVNKRFGDVTPLADKAFKELLNQES